MKLPGTFRSRDEALLAVLDEKATVTCSTPKHKETLMNVLGRAIL